MTRKKVLVLLGSMCLALVLVAMACAGPAPTTPAPTTPAPTTPAPTTPPSPSPSPIEEPIVLTYTEYGPPTHVRVVGGVYPFCEEVEKRTGGRVKFDVRTGASIIPHEEAFKGIGAGIADSGTISIPYYPTEAPLHQLGALAFLSPTPMVAGKAWWDVRDDPTIGPVLEEELAKHNLISVFPQPQPSIQVMFKDKRVTTLEELEGLRMRGDTLMARAFDALGAVPVSMTFSEIYGALEKGVLDGSQTYIHTVSSFRFYEVINYWLNVDFGSAGCDVIGAINLDTWKSLPPDIQQVILDVGRESSVNLASYLEGEVTSEANILLEEAGVEILSLTSEERDRWIDLARPVVVDTFRAEAVKKGLPWDEAYKIYLKAIESHL